MNKGLAVIAFLGWMWAGYALYQLAEVRASHQHLLTQAQKCVRMNKLLIKYVEHVEHKGTCKK